MRIFIDESGTFLPSATKDHAFSVVGAAIIPGRFSAKIEAGFNELAQHWPRDKGEIKGRLLQEQHIADLCKFLEPFEVIFEATAMELNLVSTEVVKDHQRRQGEKITENLTHGHAKAVIDKLWELRRTVEGMPPQLYLQFVSLTQLVWRCFRNGTLYYCQRFPGELGKFEWTIDAKDRKLTESESWWRDIVRPAVEHITSGEPLPRLKGGDYSAFDRNFPSRRAPQHKRKRMTNPNGLVGDLKGIFGKTIAFQQSHMVVGLQIADVLTNALRRALSGNLGVAGWHPLGDLMIGSGNGSIHFIGVGGTDGKRVSEHVAKVAQGHRDFLADRQSARTRRMSGRD